MLAIWMKRCEWEIHDINLLLAKLKKNAMNFWTTKCFHSLCRQNCLYDSLKHSIISIIFNVFGNTFFVATQFIQNYNGNILRLVFILRRKKKSIEINDTAYLVFSSAKQYRIHFLFNINIMWLGHKWSFNISSKLYLHCLNESKAKYHITTTTTTTELAQKPFTWHPSLDIRLDGRYKHKTHSIRTPLSVNSFEHSSRYLAAWCHTAGWWFNTNKHCSVANITRRVTNAVSSLRNGFDFSNVMYFFHSSTCKRTTHN